MSEHVAEAMSDVWPSYDTWADELRVPESVPIEDAEPIDAAPEPSSGSRPTIPCPPPMIDEAMPPTSRCPVSAAFSERPISVEILSR